MAARGIGRPPPSCVRLSCLDLLRSRGPAPSGVGLDKKGGGGCQVSRLGSPSLRPPLASCSPSLARRSAPTVRSRWTCTARPWTRGRQRSSPVTGTTSDTGPNGSRVACSSSSCSPHVRPPDFAARASTSSRSETERARRSANRPRPWPRPATRSIARTTRREGSATSCTASRSATRTSSSSRSSDALSRAGRSSRSRSRGTPVSSPTARDPTSSTWARSTRASGLRPRSRAASCTTTWTTTARTRS